MYEKYDEKYLFVHYIIITNYFLSLFVKSNNRSANQYYVAYQNIYPNIKRFKFKFKKN